MGPDEDHPNIDNNGFTNAAAQLAIRYKHTESDSKHCLFVNSCLTRLHQKIRLPWQLWKGGLCGSIIPIWWLEIADGLVVEYDRFFLPGTDSQPHPFF